MNFTSLKFILLIAATIAKVKPRPAADRQLLIANFEEKSLKLTLKWSDKATKIVKLESLGDIDEDCFYKGSYIQDSNSTILMTGCENEKKNIMIQSPIFGDYLGTITVDGTFEEACKCRSSDDVCWDNCFSESNAHPCGLIRTCQKYPQHPFCKDVPTKIPERCITPTTTPWPPTTTPNPMPNPGTSTCECSNQTIMQNGILSGDCHSKSSTGRYWCYVNVGSACGDEEKAQYSGFLFSYHACDLRREHGIASPARRPARRPL